jgi:DNA mismatch repair protein MLH1
MVGLIDPRFALIQHETRLYLCNTEKLSEELFYQILLFRFGNLNVLRLSEPAPITELALLAVDLDPALAPSAPSGADVRGEAVRINKFLTSKGAMLWDYFSIELKDGNLLSLPDLVPGFVPQLDALPIL